MKTLVVGICKREEALDIGRMLGFQWGRRPGVGRRGRGVS